MSRRRNAPTQRELEKQEEQEFLDNTRERFVSLLDEYFLSQGHLVLAADYGLCNLEIARPVRPIADEFFQSQRLVREGGSLTAKRKESMLLSIYAIEGLNQQLGQPHPLDSLYHRYLSVSGWSGFFYKAGIVLGVIGLLFHVLLAIAGPALLLGVFIGMKANRIKDEVLSAALSIGSEI